MYKGYGVHHNAIGVKDLKIMRPFYQETLEFNRIFVDFPQAEYPALHEVVRAPHPVYIAPLLYQEAGGIIVELTQMVDPPGRPIRQEYKYGDIGQAKTAIPVADLDKLYQDPKGKVNFCSGLKSVKIPGWGSYRFVYARDPEGNLIEFVSSEKLPVKGRFGGVQWVGVSVTDLERSMAFYQKYGGFDQTFIPTHESFSGQVDEISGGKGTRVRSCVLASSQGGGMVELFEVSQPRGRSIPFAARWGDYGYLQVCLNGKQGEDIFKIAAYFEKEGIEFASGPQLMHDEKEGAFFYMKDPDGVMIEFLNFLK
jgi:catechol 2,3-dioxygenase-like lactoylglutathione lyase family enzyme